MNSAHLKSDSETDGSILSSEFRASSQALSEMLLVHGIEISPYQSSELTKFSQLTIQNQITVIKDLKSYVKLCRDEMSESGSLKSSQTFTWRAIGEMGLIPPIDLFTNIKDTDVVEIYDLSNIQRFRNFEFFRFCSYTIEDLYTRPWPELFVRMDERVTQGIMTFLTSMIANHDRRVVKTNIGAQIIKEVDSCRKLVNELDVRFLALLYDRQDKPAAFIGIENARRLPGPQPLMRPIERLSDRSL